MFKIEQQSCHKFIFKLHSKRLRKAGWNLELSLEEAMKNSEDIVSLNDSQVLRFIDEINNTADSDMKAKAIKRKIRTEKRKPKSRESKVNIRELYRKLYEIQYQKDYICIIMDSVKDYDRANLGFSVNGIKYRRFLGTNGGIKKSTIVYVNEEIYPELKKRMDNGRNPDIPLVPAKLEAYQALMCSGSIPLPEPKGIIVVNDCVTHFKDDVIMLDDADTNEPTMSYIKDHDIEYTDSDGYGFMTPEYSKKVNGTLNGDYEHTISGFNSRDAWDKGMVYTFDYIEFGEKIAGTYMIKDAWGDWRDVRDSEVILTTSMLKLWDSYENWEDYYKNCKENHYQLSAAKVTPAELENVRTTNYQFLQSYDFTDDELRELCQPTIDEIRGVLGMDYKKSVVFLAGFGLNDKNLFNITEAYIKALMIEPKLINDPFIRRRIYNMIKKRIELAKKGSIKINANFATVCGDPYSLAQSMFDLEVTGLLQSGEIYHKYWIDKGSSEITCFRAPMTCHNNIRKLSLRNTEEMQHWYQYLTTVAILNSWDTTCDAMNGQDKDGDTNMDTDNPIICKKTLNSPTIMCVQRKAAKIIPQESDIIQANKLAFGDDIGTITNYITSMISVQAGFPKDSEEYKELDYRIMCGQLYQQNAIDRAKGIIAKPMPENWYSSAKNRIHEEDSAETADLKKFNMRIVADKKPYFMIYVYPTLRKEYSTYTKNADKQSLFFFGKTISQLESAKTHTDDEDAFLTHYHKFMPVNTNPCVVNRICWMFEKEFDDYLSKNIKSCDFDYSILKNESRYSQKDYDRIYAVYQEYLLKVDSFHHRARIEKMDKFDSAIERQMFVDAFKSECETICPNENELCNIILDICYKSDKSKQFAWDICGDTIVKNLLENHNYIINYPTPTKDVADFEYCGVNFEMKQLLVTEDVDL